MTTAVAEKEKVITLLLLLSRTSFTDDERALAENSCRSLNDWKLFTDLAIRHGVAALVWQNINDLGLSAAVPETERAILEGMRFKTIARVSYITAAAAEAVTALENEGIRVLLLKGLALEHSVYGSRGLRQMSDADLLVAPEDVLRARDILVRNGFVSDPMKSSLYRQIILDLGNHLPEIHRSGISIDLHYRLFGPEGTTIIRRALDDPEMISAGGRTFFALPPGTALLGLVNHIFKHEVKGEFQLRLYTDIYLLLMKYGEGILDEKLMAEASEAGIADEMRVVMTIIEKFFGIAVPSAFHALEGPGQERVGAFRYKLLDPGAAKPLSQRDLFRENLRSLKGMKRKLIFITGDLFPSVEFMKNRYGCQSALSAFLYYPHRLGKLIWIFDIILAKPRVK
jgi:hypothetical protein